jgi:hypothetical protein
MPDKKILRLAAGAIFVIGAVAFSAHAFNEPDGFRGVPWGASEATMRAARQVTECEDLSSELRRMGHRGCAENFDLGRIPVRANYFFRADRFVRVVLKFPPNHFDRVAAIFIERYGPPTTREQDKLFWFGASTAMSLHRYMSATSSGFASITTLEERKESLRIQSEQTKDAAKGL